MKSKRGFIFAILFIAYTSIYVARLNLTVASPVLKEMSVLDASRIGILGSVFSVIYAVGRLLNGTIGDRRPPYVMICTGLVAAGAANILVGTLPPVIGIVLLWGINAYAQSMLWSSVLCAVSAVYEPEKAGKMTSYMVTSVAVGNILGIILNTVLVTRFGAAYAFILPGAVTAALALPVWLLIRRIPGTVTADGAHIPVYRLLSRREVRIAALPALLHGVMKDNISLWMTVYFVDRFAIDLGSSAYFVLFIPLVGFVGRMAYPAVYRLCRNREHDVSVIGFAVCLLAAAGVCFCSSPIPAAICLSLIYAAVSMINTSFLSIFPLRFAHSGNVASVSGIMDFSTYLGAGIGSMTYGFLIKHFGYSPMFLSWAVISGISIVILRCFLCRTKISE